MDKRWNQINREKAQLAKMDRKIDALHSAASAAEERRDAQIAAADAASELVINLTAALKAAEEKLQTENMVLQSLSAQKNAAERMLWSITDRYDRLVQKIHERREQREAAAKEELAARIAARHVRMAAEAAG